MTDYIHQYPRAVLGAFFVVLILLCTTITSHPEYVLYNKSSLIFLGAILAVTLYSFIPTKYWILITFFFLTMKGFVKMMTEYHAVGQILGDLCLYSLCLKLLLEKELKKKKKKAYSVNLVVVLTAIFLLSTAIQIFNSYKPSLLNWGAGFFISYLLHPFLGILLFYKAKIDSLKNVLLLLTLSIFVHIIVGIHDWSTLGSMWDSFPFYKERATQMFPHSLIGSLNYRPYGLGSVPGFPSTISLIGFFSLILLLKNKMSSTLNQVIFTIYFILCLSIILICQIRTNLLTIGLILFCFLFYGVKNFAPKLKLIVLVTILTLLAFYSASQLSKELPIENILTRAETLKSREVLTNSRNGTWARIFCTGRYTMMGTGLGRSISALGSTDNVPGCLWSENVYNQIFTEAGVFGLVSYQALLIVMLLGLFIKGTHTSRTVGLILLFGFIFRSYGSKLLLISGSATYFWLFWAYGMRMKYYEREQQQKSKTITPSL